MYDTLYRFLTCDNCLLILILSVIGFFIFGYFQWNRRIGESTRSLMEKYSEYVGARWGLTKWTAGHVSSPMANLVITKEYLELQIFLAEDYRFERQDIQQITIERMLWSRGIRIQHTNRACPAYIAVGSQNLNHLKDKLAEFGYSVKGG